LPLKGLGYQKNKGEFVIKKLAIAMILVLLLIVAIKSFSKEDDWICKDGQWEKHGNPSAPMPEKTCS